MGKQAFHEKMVLQLAELDERIDELEARGLGASPRHRIDARARSERLKLRRQELKEKLTRLRDREGPLDDALAEIQSDWDDLVRAFEDWAAEHS